ncbi:hypothetical protein [Pandoraea norimbergensis]|uniref:hypothetical protein n=1 Tax=Pandoraea norimbergensis TaxID=93219 RepID=UPI0012F49DDB|nr:hypothetical protein [Pandoraea norimbergensis]
MQILSLIWRPAISSRLTIPNIGWCRRLPGDVRRKFGNDALIPALTLLYAPRTLSNCVEHASGKGLPMNAGMLRCGYAVKRRQLAITRRFWHLTPDIAQA